MGNYLEIAQKVVAEFSKSENVEKKLGVKEEQVLSEWNGDPTKHPLVLYALKLFEGEIIEVIPRSESKGNTTIDKT